MKPYILELPLRTIRFQLQEKEETPLDASGISFYVQLHKDQYEIKKLTEEYGKEVNKMKSIVSDLKLAYHALETETKKYGTIAGFTDEDARQVLPFGEDGQYTIKIRHLQERLADYTQLTERYTSKKAYPDKAYAIVDEKRQLFDEAFSDFDKNYFMPINRAHETIQIDLVSFDDDCNEFKEVCAEADEMLDRLIDEWNDMCEEINEINGKIENLNPHIKSISDAINASRGGSENFGLN